MEITRKILEQFHPCVSRWENYLKYYSKWKGSLQDFMYLPKISADDKIWVFSRPIPELMVLQRKFSCLCMDRCQTDIIEVKNFQLLVLLMYESTDYTSIEHLKDESYSAAYGAAHRAADSAADSAAYWAAHRVAYGVADSAAYWAADSAADSAAYWAAEREIQVDIIKHLLAENDGGEI